MSWAVLMDLLFTLGAMACAGFLAYGGCLCGTSLQQESPDTHPRTIARSQVHSDPGTEEFSSSAALPLLATLLVATGIGLSRFLS